MTAETIIEILFVIGFCSLTNRVIRIEQELQRALNRVELIQETEKINNEMIQQFIEINRTQNEIIKTTVEIQAEKDAI